VSDLQALIHRARKAGWSVTVRGGGHLAWASPSGDVVVFSGATPSDWRAQANIKARLKRAGLHTDGDPIHAQK